MWNFKLFYLCIFFALSSQLNAQFDISTLDKKLLEHQIKTLIDSTRIANKLPPLYNDSILFVASNHHASYLQKKGILSHEEKENKTCFSPQNRAMFYGAPKNYYVGENVAYTLYNSQVKVKNKVFQTNSYEEIARSLVCSWVNSKGHFKNIIDSQYQLTGLAISVDPKLKRVYACQKFAFALYSYDFYESRSFFPYSTLNRDSVSKMLSKTFVKADYPYDLKDDKVKNCEECKENWSAYPPISVRVLNNNFILRIENADFVKQLIQNKKDGFAVEIVPFDAFACGNPAYDLEASRRNDQMRSSGLILEPIYRNDLIKGFKKRKKVKNLTFVKYLFTADSVSFFKRFGTYKLVNFDAAYFEMKIGRIPKDLNGWWNHNLMYIHNNQICHVVFLTNYPGKLDTELMEMAYLPPKPVNDYEFKIEHFADTLELFYALGQTSASSKDLEKMIKKFEEKNLIIKNIQIQGFCSIEGDSLTNENLHQQRAEKILTELRKLSNPKTKYSIKSEVAWNHFYSSVQNHPKWKFLFHLSKNEVLSYLANPKNEKPNDILAQERKVKVIVIADKELSPKTASYYFYRDLANLYFKDERGKIKCKDEGTLVKLYEKAYYLSTVDTLSISEFLKIVIPKFEGSFSHHLKHDIAFYHYHYLRNTTEKETLSKLESEVESIFRECGAPEHLSSEFHYLSARLLIKKIEQKGKKNTTDNPDIQKAFDRLNLLLFSYQTDSNLLINVSKANLNVIHILCQTISPEEIYKYNDIINTSLIHLVEYYRKSNQLNPKTAFKLAQTLCYFKNIPLAIDICREFLYDDEILKLYLPLSYFHSSYLSGTDELNYEKEFHSLLMEAKKRLPTADWCLLFYGREGIPFQVMDNKNLHSEFCASCPNRIEEVFKE